MYTRYKRWIDLFLIAAFTALLIGNIVLYAPVQSESAHLAAGASHWELSSFALYRVNPPLVRMTAALPVVLFFEDHSSWRTFSNYAALRKEFEMGNAYMRENRETIFPRFVTARLGCLIFAVTGLVVVLLFSQNVYRAPWAGLTALILAGTSPFFLGHAATIMPDAHAASMGLLSVYFFHRWLKSPNGFHTFLAAVALGGAQLCKFTLLVFYPVFLLLAVLYAIPFRGAGEDRPKNDTFFSRLRPLRLLLIALGSVLVINAGYAFSGIGKPLRNYQFQSTLFTGRPLQTSPDGRTKGPGALANRFDGSGNRFETLLGYLPVPLPSDYVQGIDTQRLDFETGLPSYWRGQWAEHGWFGYYFYALLLKTPLGTLALFLLALFCTFFPRGYNAPWRDELTLLLPAAAILLLVSSQTGFSVHSRYMIPAIPFLLIWISKPARAFTPSVRAGAPKSSRAVRFLTVLFLLIGAGGSLWVYPHSVAFFNELAAVVPTPAVPAAPKPPESPAVVRFLDAGPLNGPRHLLDSNIDWGQDCFTLERWCRRHPEVDQIKISIWSDYLPELINVPWHNKGLPAEPEPGWYAARVCELYAEKSRYRYFWQFTPLEVLGYTVYIYHLTQEDIDAVFPEGFTAEEERPRE
ncbi:MAG: glycosyltransferase family 39 protein [Thermoguttaceae bacterium]|nr:glycosyltransferase family 39 protein [Thermoguttaceae bacterium]